MKQKYPNDKIYIRQYEVCESLPLIHTSIDYTVHKLENYLLSEIKGYTRQFNILGRGENQEMVKFLKELGYIGWFEESSALYCGILTEVMLIGDTKKYLRFIGSKEL